MIGRKTPIYLPTQIKTEKTKTNKKTLLPQLLAVFRESSLNSGAGLSELLTAINSRDFLTLEDLLRLLREVAATNKRMYEEAQERLAKREAEHKDTMCKCPYTLALTGQPDRQGGGV